MHLIMMHLIMMHMAKSREDNDYGYGICVE